MITQISEYLGVITALALLSIGVVWMFGRLGVQGETPQPISKVGGVASTTKATSTSRWNVLSWLLWIVAIALFLLTVTWIAGNIGAQAPMDAVRQINAIKIPTGKESQPLLLLVGALLLALLDWYQKKSFGADVVTFMFGACATLLMVNHTLVGEVCRNFLVNNTVVVEMFKDAPFGVRFLMFLFVCGSFLAAGGFFLNSERFSTGEPQALAQFALLCSLVFVGYAMF